MTDKPDVLRIECALERSKDLLSGVDSNQRRVAVASHAKRALESRLRASLSPHISATDDTIAR